MLRYRRSSSQMKEEGNYLNPTIPEIVSYCCYPQGCPVYYDNPIDSSSPENCIKIKCDNLSCNQGEWMHQECFKKWESQILSYFRTKTTSWTEHQRLESMWTMQGYENIYRMCDCKCGQGFIRKDTQYHNYANSYQDSDNQPLSPRLSQIKPPPGILKQNPVPSLRPITTFTSHRNALRVRTQSLTSTGSSPPSSADGTPPLTPGSGLRSAGSNGGHFEFFADSEQAAAGNIFQRRKDLSVFATLPKSQRNPYHIKLEDEGPHGNDEIRCFILTNLSTHKITCVDCLVCQRPLTIYDKYPLIDGTFFLSPQRYSSDLQVVFERKSMYLNSICMFCLNGTLKCLLCNKPWTGNCLVMGTMYTYDIFASTPCCSSRMNCKNCRRPILEPRFTYFSYFTKSVKCPYCRVEDHHFLHPLVDIFKVAAADEQADQIRSCDDEKGDSGSNVNLCY